MEYANFGGRFCQKRYKMIQKKEKQKRTKLGGRDFRGEGCRQDWRIDMQRDRRIDMQRDRRIESDGKERTEKSPYSTGKRRNF